MLPYHSVRAVEHVQSVASVNKKGWRTPCHKFYLQGHIITGFEMLWQRSGGEKVERHNVMGAALMDAAALIIFGDLGSKWCKVIELNL